MRLTPLLPLPLLLLTMMCRAAAPTSQPGSQPASQLTSQPASQPALQPASLAPDSFDFELLIGDPPADGSKQQKQEIEAMLQLQASRTPEEIARCEREVDGNAFVLSDLLGKWFNSKDLPYTAALLRDITRQTKVISSAAKINWNRVRPFITDPRLKPCVVQEKSFSYPSGHATRGMVWAMVLAEIFPENRQLLERGRQFGTDRTLAGMHYPTDVAAGQKLGVEIARRILADPGYRARIAKAKEECLAVAHQN